MANIIFDKSGATVICSDCGYKIKFTTKKALNQYLDGHCYKCGTLLIIPKVKKKKKIKNKVHGYADIDW